MEPSQTTFQTILAHCKDFVTDFKKAIPALVVILVFSLFAAVGTIRDENGNLAAIATAQRVLFLPSNETLIPGEALDITVPGTKITVRLTVQSVGANKTVLKIEQTGE